MEKTNNSRTRRLRNLIIIFALTAVMVGLATYAWFIGLRTVTVTSFDVEIAGTDSLLLSLDGSTFLPTVSINSENYESYSTDNWWAGKGLIPMSTIGQIDAGTSRLKLFEKASLTPSKGGYRLLASQVSNATKEQNGYVAFDLYIKNFTGADYKPELAETNEEAIYLTVDSEVNVADSGEKNTGIENSVRVAFAQIGRVKASENSQTKIQEIKCSDKPTDKDGENNLIGITGICRAATIWEPNDTSHIEGAISYYDNSCTKRKNPESEGDTIDVTLASSYDIGTSCGDVIDGLAYPTYAINDAIPSKSNVDIYDGTAYNGYTGTTLLQSISTFTDTMKYLRGTERPTFFNLAPNSITKIRVYIYIEGQDIDNYDFASVGKLITVNFGFTKQRFTEDDFGYPGPDVNQGEGPVDYSAYPTGVDLTPPVITLIGAEGIENPAIINLDLNDPYVEYGATAIDNKDGEIPVKDIEKIGTVNTTVAGTYKVTYKVRDKANNLGTKTRTIIVTDPNSTNP